MQIVEKTAQFCPLLSKLQVQKSFFRLAIPFSGFLVDAFFAPEISAERSSQKAVGWALVQSPSKLHHETKRSFLTITILGQVLP